MQCVIARFDVSLPAAPKQAAENVIFQSLGQRTWA